MAFPKTVDRQTMTMYQRVASLYNGGMRRAEIMATLSIDNATYRRAYSYVYFRRMIHPEAPDRAAEPIKSSAFNAPRASRALAPIVATGKARSADVDIAAFIAHHGSHICQDRFNCKLPGVHLVTREQGAADFEAPVIKRPMQNQNPGWKRELDRHQAGKKAATSRRMAE